MGSIKIDLDVKIINKEDYVPFKQVMKMLKQLDEHTPNIDLHEIARNLDDQRKQARANMDI